MEELLGRDGVLLGSTAFDFRGTPRKLEPIWYLVYLPVVSKVSLSFVHAFVGVRSYPVESNLLAVYTFPSPVIALIHYSSVAVISVKRAILKVDYAYKDSQLSRRPVICAIK